MTDERILALLKQRDEQGILLLQEQYGGYCYSILYSLLRDEEAAHYGGAFAPFILTVDRLGWVCYLFCWFCRFLTNAKPRQAPTILSRISSINFSR